jgi:hypothetical protein
LPKKICKGELKKKSLGVGFFFRVWKGSRTKSPAEATFTRWITRKFTAAAAAAAAAAVVVVVAAAAVAADPPTSTPVHSFSRLARKPDKNKTGNREHELRVELMYRQVLITCRGPLRPALR